MDKTHVSTVAFIGGPFDGYEQLVPGRVEALSEIIAIPVNRNVLNRLHGRPAVPASPASSVALYELKSHADGKRYRFIQSASAGQFHLQGWRG